MRRMRSNSHTVAWHRWIIPTLSIDDAEAPSQVPRALKQSVAPVQVVKGNTLARHNLAREFGLEVPMGTAEAGLQVRILPAVVHNASGLDPLIACALFSMKQHSFAWRPCFCIRHDNIICEVLM